jgi:CheY-like chemotaxis protein
VSTTADSPHTVLLVEDNPHNRKIFSGMLTHSGFRVIEAEDGHKALAEVEKALPEIILMDLSIPGVDGWEKSTNRAQKSTNRAQKSTNRAQRARSEASYVVAPGAA